MPPSKHAGFAVALLRDGRPGVFALYVAASLVLGFAAAFLGHQLAK